MRKPMMHAGQLSSAERKQLQSLYASGAAAYGSVKNLQKSSGLSKEKVKQFMYNNDAYTKFHHIRKKFPRLKVFSKDINEIWSIVSLCSC